MLTLSRQFFSLNGNEVFAKLSRYLLSVGHNPSIFISPTCNNLFYECTNREIEAISQELNILFSFYARWSSIERFFFPM